MGMKKHKVDEYADLNTVITVDTLKGCLKEIKLDNKMLKKQFKDEKMPFHKLEDYRYNEHMIYSLKNVIRYFTVDVDI